MIAAIYARKSTSQDGRSEEEKSVTRQVERAEAFAASKGWTVAPGHVYVDEAISGAEFEAREGFMRLIGSLKPKPPFNALIVMDRDRLGREQYETPYRLKQMNQAGVAVYEYLTGQEIRLDTPVDKLVGSISAFAAEQERYQASRRTKDALLRKAQAKHVTGGRVYAYDNVPMCSADGKRSHVGRRIDETRAEIVRRIFDLCAQGFGVRRIAHLLNADRVPSPRWSPGSSRGWTPSGVRTILHQPLYKGEFVWNRSQKRDIWGSRHPKGRPQDDWVRVPAPELRIVPDDLWDAAHARLRETRQAYLRTNDGRPFGKPMNGIESRYVLTGFAVCALCGGALVARKSRGVYLCVTYLQQGRKVCTNNAALPMRATDEAVLSAVMAQVLSPEVFQAAIEEAIRQLRLTEQQQETERERLTISLKQIERELARLTQAIAAGGEIRTLVEAVQTREQQRDHLRQQLASLDTFKDDLDLKRLEKALRTRLDDWRGLLTRHVQSGRQVLRKLLDGRLRFTPNEAGGYVFEGVGRLEPVLTGTVSSQAPTAYLTARGRERRAR